MAVANHGREPSWVRGVDALTRVLHHFERPADRVKRAVKRALGLRSPISVLPFRTYGTRDRLHIHGRVLEDQRITGASRDDHVMQNLIGMLKRYASDEVPGVEVTLRLGDIAISVTTDEEGYFEAELGGVDPRHLHTPWTEVELLLEHHRQPRNACVRLVDGDATFGVISDMDDTVVKTGATTLFRQLRTLLLNNARSREPFDGVGALYRAFERGPDGAGHNPIFYVSSSPWNIFDLFEDFLAYHDIPLGPIVLRDFGIAPGKLVKRDHLSHKIGAIERIFETYPALRFILVGDTGQKDAWVYRCIALAHPGRVLAVYLRDLDPRVSDPEIEKIEQELAAVSVPMLRVADSRGAANHAHEHGWINRAQRACVREAAAEAAAPQAEGLAR
jgi:phosphatidate phosphatase APP1